MQRRTQRRSGRVASSPAKGRDIALIGLALEASNDNDIGMVPAFDDPFGTYVQYAGIAELAIRPESGLGPVITVAEMS